MNRTENGELTDRARPAGPAPQPQQTAKPAIFLMCDSLQTGGIERQFNMLARAMRSRDYQVYLGCMRADGPFLEGLGAIEEFASGGSFIHWKSFASRFRLATFLRSHNVQVAQSFDFYSNLMMVVSARLACVRAIVGCQNQLGDLETYMQKRAELLNFRWCHRIVCNSRAAAENLRQNGIPERRLLVILNGIEDALEIARPAFPHEPGRVRVALIARMNSTVKNHDVFLKAAGKIAPQHPEVEFWLVGDGPLRPSFEQLVQELGIAGSVRFIGDRRDIPAVLASIDISVVPSKSESLPNVVLESMAARKPVVASNVGGIPEVVKHGETGLLVAPGDENQLASSIELLITRFDLREAYGAAGRHVALANFSAQRLLDEHLRLYDELLRQS